jgi:hypothetical protein
MINVDNYHAKGRQHLICQDYSMSSMYPIPHVIVADGCSSSPNSDVGAMILARSAHQIIHEMYDSGNIPLNDEDFGQLTIAHAETVRKTLGMNKDCLDASLLVTFYYKKMYHIFAYGDGIISVGYCHQLEVYEIKFASEAPYYLSYLVDPPRREKYIQFAQSIGKDSVKKIYTVNNFVRTSYNKSLSFQYPDDYEGIESILISSDGVHTLKNKQTDEGVLLEDALRSFTDFRTLKGSVMKRTAKRVLKDYLKMGVSPTDDVSFGVILSGA